MRVHRDRRRGISAVCSTILIAVVPTLGIAEKVAANETQLAELDAKSRALIEETNRLLNEDLAAQRQSCAFGEAPGWVAEKRAKQGNATSFPDASGMCIAILESKAQDGKLLELYRDLLAQMGGDRAGAAAWPRAIGAAAMGGQQDVDIGRHKSIELKPALAFDAGFTVAFQEGKNSKAQKADAAQLLALAEACVGEKPDAATCFSVGYLYGANAVRGKTLSSR